ncbi:CDP-alcohol phosphatidyltransferase family protein [Halovivax gelatinilyticus]|uniref:CDP-alcohol phosphatidyltransferase family protein n=1 Tax=Halovivax gelatinilyticus TaxID=2961597 RepID=UPI0020CA441F|nr:CDP-alcohol phosphatidyltransferase family protein [Halovivax gelatinilyticus]
MSRFDRIRRLDGASNQALEGALGAVILAGVGVLVVAAVRPSVRTTAFPAWVALALGCQLLVVAGVVERTRRRGEDVRLTAATHLTVSRTALLALLIGVVAAVPESTAWVAGGLFGAAVILDGLDGAVARRRDDETVLGARLDRDVDGLTTLVGAGAAVAVGAAPTAFLAVGLARYGFVLGCWWRRRRGRRVRDLPPNRLRAPLSVLVLVAIWVALVPPVPDAWTAVIASAVAGPFLANFAWDWLAVTGRLSRLSRSSTPREDGEAVAREDD